MTYPLEPERPRPPATPPAAPLPRLRAPGVPRSDGPEPKGEADRDRGPSPSKKSAREGADAPSRRRGADARAKAKDDPPKGKLEETPVLDTYEARKRARLVVGFVALGMAALAGLLIFRQFSPPEEDLPEDPLAAALARMGDAPAAPDRGRSEGAERSEREARNMFEQARRIAVNGDATQAVAMLERVSAAYPGSKASEDAKQALARPSQGLPLFPEGGGSSTAAPEAPAEPGTAPGEAVAIASPADRIAASPEEALKPDPVAPATKPLPPGFRARPEAGVHASGWPLEIAGGRDGATMAFIPGGEFLMGRDDGDLAERPAHRVTLSAYYIDQHEVTARQYALFLKDSGARRPRKAGPGAPDGADSPDLPKVMVDADEAAAYAEWSGKRLPTEAEWELAARTPDGRIYPWGASPPTSEKPRVPRKVEPVMANAGDVSPYRVFDLAGNAWEWTADWFDPRYYQQLRGGNALNPAGPARPPRSQLRAVRGGSRLWLSTWREGLRPETRLPYLGFRCALSLEGLEGPAAAPSGSPPPPTPAAPAASPEKPGVLVPF